MLVIYQEGASGPLGVFLAIWDAVHSHTDGKALAPDSTGGSLWPALDLWPLHNDPGFGFGKHHVDVGIRHRGCLS